METRTLGALELSVVGLGTNNFGRNVDAAGTARVVDAAIDAGVTFIDTADRYADGRSEELLGQVLQGRRDEVVLATKFGLQFDDDPAHKGGGRAWVLEAVEGSLRRLRTDRIDLYQLHFPDPETPIEETLGALAELREQGKILEAGCSNMSAAQLEEAITAAEADDRLAPMLCVQNEYSLLNRTPDRDGVLELCARRGVGFVPYYPLASGLLTGKYTPGEPPPPGSRFATVDRYQPMWTERNLDLAARLAAFAEQRGRDVLELAISWLLSRPAVISVICGATRPEQVVANARAAGWTLDADDLAELDRLTLQD